MLAGVYVRFVVALLKSNCMVIVEEVLNYLILIIDYRKSISASFIVFVKKLSTKGSNNVDQV